MSIVLKITTTTIIIRKSPCIFMAAAGPHPMMTIISQVDSILTRYHQNRLKSEKSWVVSTQNEDLADDRQLFIILCPYDSYRLYIPHIISIDRQGIR